MPEKKDYIFSEKQARIKAVFAKLNGGKQRRTFINGREYTECGRSPLISAYNDAVYVARGLSDATDDASQESKNLITYRDEPVIFRVFSFFVEN